MGTSTDGLFDFFHHQMILYFEVIIFFVIQIGFVKIKYNQGSGNRLQSNLAFLLAKGPSPAALPAVNVPTVLD